MADGEGRTPAHYAAHHGNLESLRLLVKNAVDISIGEFFYLGYAFSCACMHHAHVELCVQ